DVLVLLEEVVGERLATGLVLERGRAEVVLDVRADDLDVGLDRLRAELVALDVAHARSADARAADRADRALGRGAGRDDPGEVAGLVFLEVDRDVLRKQGLRVTLAGEGAVR